MALLQPLCNTQPRVSSSLHHHRRQPSILRARHKHLHFASSTKLQLSLFHPSSILRRRILLPPPKSSSINGYSVQASPEAYVKDTGELEVGRFDGLRKLFAFVRSIFPGGSWWSFDDDVQMRILAEPVTVARALTRMWELVAKDRWIIFGAFTALILAAVSFERLLLSFFFFTGQSFPIN